MSVALAALFVAMSGTGYAATQLSKNSVTTKAIKNSAVTGAKIKSRTIDARDVKKNTLTGAEINEQKLKSVPSADKVGGLAAADLVTKSGFIQWNVPMNRGDAPKTLAAFGPFTITGRCEVAGANTNAFIDVTTSSNDTYSSGDSDFDIGETDNLITTNFAANARSYTADEPYFLDPATGLSALDDDGEPIGVWYGFPGADCRFVGSVPVTRP